MWVGLWTAIAIFGDRQGESRPLYEMPHVLILACNRKEELDTALYALSQAHLAHAADVTVSVDCPDGPDSSQYSQSFHSIRFVDSYQRYVPFDAWKDERVARHWLSAITRVFREGHARVLYLEEDHVVMPDIFYAANRFQRPDSCSTLNLACHKPCNGRYTGDAAVAGKGLVENIAIVHYSHTWAAFIHSDELVRFCSARGDWDINLHNLGIAPSYQVYKPRAYHLPSCTSSRTGKVKFGGRYCGNRAMQYRGFLDEWRRTTSIVQRVIEVPSQAWSPKYTAAAPPAMKRRCLEAI